MEFCNCAKNQPSLDGRSCERCGKWFDPQSVNQGTPSNIPSYDGQPADTEAAVEISKQIVSGEFIKNRPDIYGRRETRTREQWQQLVNDFGAEKVCHFEDITQKQLFRKCHPSFSETLKEKIRIKNLERLKG